MLEPEKIIKEPLKKLDNQIEVIDGFNNLNESKSIPYDSATYQEPLSTLLSDINNGADQTYSVSRNPEDLAVLKLVAQERISLLERIEELQAEALRLQKLSKQVTAIGEYTNLNQSVTVPYVESAFTETLQTLLSDINNGADQTYSVSRNPEDLAVLKVVAQERISLLERIEELQAEALRLQKLSKQVTAIGEYTNLNQSVTVPYVESAFTETLQTLLSDINNGADQTYSVSRNPEDLAVLKVVAQERIDLLKDIANAPEEIRTAFTSPAPNFDQIGQLISTISVKDRNDLQRKDELQRLVRRVKKFVTVQNIYRLLSSEDIEVDKMNAEIRVLNSEDPEERQIASQLTSLVQQKRLNLLESDLLQKLTVDNVDFDQIVSEAGQIVKIDPNARERATVLIRRINTLQKQKIEDFVRRIEAEALTAVAAEQDFDYQALVNAINTFPQRNVQEIQFAQDILVNARALRRKLNEVRARQLFYAETAPQVLERITDLPEDDFEDQELKVKLLKQYKEFVRVRKRLRPNDYDVMFEKEIEIIRANGRVEYTLIDLGMNKPAFNFVRGKFAQNILPIVEAFRGQPETSDEMQKRLFSLSQDDGAGPASPRLRYLRRVRNFRKQRQEQGYEEGQELTTIEDAYLRSTELLASFNPYLVALASIDLGVSSFYLQHHFDTLSTKTKETIKEGQYFPLVFIGTGPNGLSGIGETVRLNPRLASQSLIIDQGEQPGGPFAIPNGPAWNLNSANASGEQRLPNKPGEKEVESVRAYAASTRFYPGERLEGQRETRPGSINAVVDWLPPPDDLSNARYPTNEELQVMLSFQAALCCQNVLLETKVIRSEPNTDPNLRGSEKVTLLMKFSNGEEKEAHITTDNLVISSGLGEPSYGFDPRGKNAERIILDSQQQTEALPKVSTTLDAFRAFADRTEEEPANGLGEVLVITGKGNSLDTLLEYISGIFNGPNSKRIKDKVKKIYVIAPNVPENAGDYIAQQRARYIANADFIDRPDRPGLVSFISGRVEDYQYVDDSVPVQERKLRMINENGEPITKQDGSPIIADNVISATGFRPQLDLVLSSYLNGKSLVDDETRKPFTLPTNPQVGIAETIAGKPNILLIGTASRPQFNSTKLLQLPPSSANVLLAVGEANGVAIGFRAIDSQAALREFIRANEFDLEDEKPRVLEKAKSTEDFLTYDQFEINPELPKIPENVDVEIMLNTLIGAVLEDVEFFGKEKMDYSGNFIDTLFNGQITFDVSQPDKSDMASAFTLNISNFLSLNGDRTEPSGSYKKIINRLLKDTYVQSCILRLLSLTRGSNPVLEFVLSIKRGRIYPRDSFVEKVNDRRR